jgi:hypothetical protein
MRTTRKLSNRKQIDELNSEDERNSCDSDSELDKIKNDGPTVD